MIDIQDGVGEETGKLSNSYLGMLWQSFVRVQGAVLGALGVGISLLVWEFQANSSVPLVPVVPPALAALIALLTLADSGYRAWQARERELPAVVFASAEVPGISEAEVVCLLEPSVLFSFGMQVSFYHLSPDGFEFLVGIGRVINVQDDGRI